MGRLTERVAVARKALGTLEKALPQAGKDDVARDAAIQRFEYSCETVWRAAQAHLEEVGGVRRAAPKEIIRACFASELLDEAETTAALRMVDDRNLTSHTYDEALAMELVARLPAHAALLSTWLSRLGAGRLREA